MIAIDEQCREDPEADQREAVLLELPPGELVLAEGLEADLVVDRGRCGHLLRSGVDVLDRHLGHGVVVLVASDLSPSTNHLWTSST